jgi:hypothetical protein
MGRFRRGGAKKNMPRPPQGEEWLPAAAAVVAISAPQGGCCHGGFAPAGHSGISTPCHQYLFPFSFLFFFPLYLYPALSSFSLMLRGGPFWQGGLAETALPKRAAA